LAHDRAPEGNSLASPPTACRARVEDRLDAQNAVTASMRRLISARVRRSFLSGNSEVLAHVHVAVEREQLEHHGDIALAGPAAT